MRGSKLNTWGKEPWTEILMKRASAGGQNGQKAREIIFLLYLRWKKNATCFIQ